MARGATPSCTGVRSATSCPSSPSGTPGERGKSTQTHMASTRFYSYYYSWPSAALSHLCCMPHSSSGVSLISSVRQRQFAPSTPPHPYPCLLPTTSGGADHIFPLTRDAGGCATPWGSIWEATANATILSNWGGVSGLGGVPVERCFDATRSPLPPLPPSPLLCPALSTPPPPGPPLTIRPSACPTLHPLTPRSVPR